MVCTYPRAEAHWSFDPSICSLHWQGSS